MAQSRLAVLIAAALFALLLLVIIESRQQRPTLERPVPISPELETHLMSLGDSVTILSDEIRRLRSELAITFKSDAGEYESPDKAVADLGKILSESLARLAAAHGPQLPVRQPAQSHAVALEKAYTEFESPDHESYLAWTYSQILNRFGQPDSIQASAGNVRWSYTAKEDRLLRFTFTDGRITRVSR